MGAGMYRRFRSDRLTEVPVMTFTAPATPRGRTRRQSAIRTNRARLPDPDTLTANILSVYDARTAAEQVQGLRWYADAREVADEVARTAALPNRHGAGVIAALSPQTSWHANIGMALEAAVKGTADDAPHCADACDKATAILSGAEPSEVLGGRKVRSFYANISRPRRSGPVTIDRHAVAICLRGLEGADTSRFDPVPPSTLERIGVYTYLASAFRGAADRTDLRPHEMQAVTWVTWRRLTGADVHDRPQEEF